MSLAIAALTTSTASAAGATSFITSQTGTVTASSHSQTIKLNASQVKPGKIGAVLVALRVHSPDSLDPGKISVCVLGGKTCPVYASVVNLPGSKDSYAVALLKLDTAYYFSINGEHNTHGSYQTTLSLAGDVNNDGTVTSTDTDKIHQLKDVKYGNSAYSLAADVSGNGNINAIDRLLGTMSRGAQVVAAPVNPLDVPLPSNAIAVSGISTTSFNSPYSKAKFTLTGSTFTKDPADTTVTLNGQAVEASKVTITDTTVESSKLFADGKNVLKLKSYDAEGRNLYHEVAFWVGQSTLTVHLVDSQGNDFLQPTQVKVLFPEDTAISLTGATNTSHITFKNVPNRTVIIKATAAGGYSGVTGGVGSDSATLVMKGIGEPSDTDNNDFSQGTTGWNIGSAPVQIVDHVENAGPTLTASLKSTSLSATPASPRSTAQSEQLTEKLLSPDSSKKMSAAAITDKDLVLGTAGEGLQSISRTFTTDPGVTGVEVRYRFVTSEVPGGYFGSKYNDYFNVQINSQKGGDATEANSMNGLGLGSFDSGGSTGWRTTTLSTDVKGDTIAVNVGVANVADGLYQSQVVVDFVKEIKTRVIPTLSWNNTQGGLNLSYTVEGEKLADAVDVSVNFASGPTYTDRLGAAVFTKSVAAGTQPGTYGPFPVAGSLLSGDPAGTTHLVASSSEKDFGAVGDVQIGWGANADPAVVSAGMSNLVKDSLRAAGQSSASINSTARGPADQARAMFQNLTNPAHTIAQNITTQRGIYAPAGDAVVNAFATAVAGLTPAQIQAQSAQIQTAMVAEINTQGCQNVTRHCADPALLSVVDVGAAAFNATNGPLFVAAAQAGGAHVIDERKTNSCYHLEL